MKYSRIPISQTLNISKLPITRAESHFLSSVKHYIFTLIFQTNFCFPRKFTKSGSHCKINESAISWNIFKTGRAGYKEVQFSSLREFPLKKFPSKPLTPLSTLPGLLDTNFFVRWGGNGAYNQWTFSIWPTHVNTVVVLNGAGSVIKK